MAHKTTNPYRKQRPTTMSLPKVRDRLRDTIPERFVPSVATLSRMETSATPPEAINSIVIVALANIYGCKVSDLSMDAASEQEVLRDLLINTSTCINGSDPDQMELFVLAGAA